MKIELTDSEINKIEQFFTMLDDCYVEVLILHTYAEDKRKGYIESRILDRDDELDYASGKCKVRKDQVIERVSISDYCEPIFDILDVAIVDGKEGSRFAA